MDVVALASVVTTGVVASLGTAAALLSPLLTARAERRRQHEDHVTGAVSAALRIAEYEGAALAVLAERWRLAGAGLPFDPITVSPDLAARADAFAGLSAYTPTHVREAFSEWRAAADVAWAEVALLERRLTADGAMPAFQILISAYIPTEEGTRRRLAEVASAELASSVLR